MKTTTIVLLVIWPLATLGDLDGARPLQRRLQEKRSKYDARVNQWLRENPQHSFPPEDTTVEDLWERLQDADRQSARGFVSTDPHPPASETRLRPRKIATAQGIDEAETILNSAIFEAEKRVQAQAQTLHPSTPEFFRPGPERHRHGPLRCRAGQDPPGRRHPG